MSDTEQDLERRIRERAYFLWLEAGSPAGLAEAHWQQACEEFEMARWEAEQRRVDEENEESFPASDPPSHTGITGERSD
ncbi:MAG TPA: DUF2934 domain-containing protein [Roseomonas sp.]|nr:DUF2934 domain-containing protein [Roseomonas sp.]